MLWISGLQWIMAEIQIDLKQNLIIITNHLEISNSYSCVHSMAITRRDEIQLNDVAELV